VKDTEILDTEEVDLYDVWLEPYLYFSWENETNVILLSEKTHNQCCKYFSLSFCKINPRGEKES